VHLDLFHLKIRLPDTPHKGTVRSGRPYSQNASGTQRRKSNIQSKAGIQPVIPLTGQTLRAIIHIKQDSIIGPSLIPYQLYDINRPNIDPHILEGMARQMGKGPAVPFHYCWYQFSNYNLRPAPDTPEGRSQGVPHAEPPYEQAGTRPVSNPRAREFCEGVLRSMDPAVHELTLIKSYRKLGSPSVKKQLSAGTGDPRTVDKLPGNHGLCAFLLLITLNNNPAYFTSVSGLSPIYCSDLFKVILLSAACLKAFRAMPLSQFISPDGQMAAPAP